MRLYKIKDWNRVYENNRTREMKRLGWVPVPNKQDGDGFCAVMHHEDGLKIFGAWVLMLQIASKCEPRGTLIRSNGAPHTERTIARMTGAQEGDIYIAMQYLASSDVDWLCYEDVTIPQEGAALPQEGAGIPQEPANFALEQKGKEQKGKEEEPAAAPPVKPPAKKGQAGLVDAIVLPQLLGQSPEFVKAWGEWKAHRKEKRAPLTLGAAEKQLAQFEEWGVEKSIAAINQSIMGGWQGVFEPKGRLSTNKPGPSSDDLWKATVTGDAARKLMNDLFGEDSNAAA